MATKRLRLVSDEAFTKIVSESRSYREAALAIGASPDSVGRRIHRLGLDISHFIKSRPRTTQYAPLVTRNKSRHIDDLSDAEFSEILRQVGDYNTFARALGRKGTGGGTFCNAVAARAKRLGLSMDHWDWLRPTQDGSRGRNTKALLRKGGLSYGAPSYRLISRLEQIGRAKACEVCQQGEEWQGQPLGLMVHYRNFDTRDLRPENMMIVCPNCYSQLVKPRQQNSGRVSSVKRRENRRLERYRSLLRE